LLASWTNVGPKYCNSKLRIKFKDISQTLKASFTTKISQTLKASFTTKRLNSKVRL